MIKFTIVVIHVAASRLEAAATAATANRSAKRFSRMKLQYCPSAPPAPTRRPQVNTLLEQPQLCNKIKSVGGGLKGIGACVPRRKPRHVLEHAQRGGRKLERAGGWIGCQIRRYRSKGGIHLPDVDLFQWPVAVTQRDMKAGRPRPESTRVCDALGCRPRFYQQRLWL